MNNKAISSGQAVTFGIIIVLIISVAVAAYLGIDTPGINESDAPVTIFIDDVAYTQNLTTARTLDWTGAVPGNTYTKNVTAINNDNQNLTLQLFTTEPLGSTLTWTPNNTLLAASTSISGTLTNTLDTITAAGPYTWKLYATNTTIIPQPTPSPNPSPAPPNNLQFTIEAQIGVQNITFAINNDQMTLLQTDLPATFICQSTDTLTFRTAPSADYMFNGWLIDDLTPKSSNPLVLTGVTGNFTIQAKYLPT